MVQFKQNQAVWQQTLAGISQPTLYWSNHDMARLRTRVAKTDTQNRSLAMLMYLQRGIPIIYYGEELGLKNLKFNNIEQFKDQTVHDFVAQAIQAGLSQEEALEMVSKTHKMPARGIMPWNDEENYGFSKAALWIRGEKQDDFTVANEIDNANSMINFYRQLIQLKKTDLFQKGSYYLLATDKNSYIYQRDYHQQSTLVAVSLSNSEIQVQIPQDYKNEELLAGKYKLNKGQLTLAPYSGVVLSKSEGEKCN